MSGSDYDLNNDGNQYANNNNNKTRRESYDNLNDNYTMRLSVSNKDVIIFCLINN